jgi:hypothetical protein
MPKWFRAAAALAANAVIIGLPTADRFGRLPGTFDWFNIWAAVFAGNFVASSILVGGTRTVVQKTMVRLGNAIRALIAAIELGTEPFPDTFLHRLLGTLIRELRNLTNITEDESIYTAVLLPSEDGQTLKVIASSGATAANHARIIQQNTHKAYWEAYRTGETTVDPDTMAKREYGKLQSIAAIPLFKPDVVNPVGVIALGADFPNIFKEGPAIHRIEEHVGPYLDLIQLALTIDARRKNGKRKPRP